MIRQQTSRRSPTRGPKTPKPTRGGGPKRPVAKRVTVRPDTEPDKPAPVLSAQRRRQLRADAHALEPVVQVGHGGVSEAVIRAVRSALADHELVKVRLHEPEDKQAMANLLAEQTRAALCGLVGHTVILYRPKPRQKPVSGVARSAIKRNQPRRTKQRSSRARA